MTKEKKWLRLLVGGVVVLTLVLGATLAFAQTDDGTDVDEPFTEGESGPIPDGPLFPGRGGHGRPGFGGRSGGNEWLAEALGITVEELQAAHEAARTAAIEQAVAEGLITQEQADGMLEGGMAPGGGRGFGRHDSSGFGDTIDFEALLADALGVTVEELQAARDAAHDARLAQMVEEGVMTQEQVDTMLAYQAVKEYVDTEAVQAYLQATYEAAVQQALDDGVITQEQADQILSDDNGGGFGGLRNFGGGFGGRRGPGGHRGPGGFGKGQGFGFSNHNAPPTAGDNT